MITSSHKQKGNKIEVSKAAEQLRREEAVKVLLNWCTVRRIHFANKVYFSISQESVAKKETHIAKRKFTEQIVIFRLEHFHRGYFWIAILKNLKLYLSM